MRFYGTIRNTQMISARSVITRMDEQALLDRLKEAVIRADAESVESLANDALRLGIDPVRVIEDGLASGLRVVGERFSRLELFLSDTILSAEAMTRGVTILKPAISEKEEAGKSRTIVIGTVRGDIHDIGKNLVSTVLTANSYDVHDLGNTRIITFSEAFSSAGPCTEMILYESVAPALAVVSGAHAGPGPAGCGTKEVDRFTGLEERFYGEVVKSLPGKKLEFANEIAKAILPKYEHMFANPSLGKRFHECYDVEKMTPTAEWLAIWKSVRREMKELGLELGE